MALSLAEQLLVLSAPVWGQSWLSQWHQALCQPHCLFQPDYTSLSPVCFFFLSFLCIAEFSLLSARIAKTPQWSWREMPGLEDEPRACFSLLLKWPKPHKNFFSIWRGTKEELFPGACYQFPGCPVPRGDFLLSPSILPRAVPG